MRSGATRPIRWPDSLIRKTRVANWFALTRARAAAALACAALSGCSYVLLPPNVQHVAPASRSVAEADAKLAQAAARRAAVEAEFAASEQVCYTKFFVNSCLDKAREKRRSELSIVRAIEIEAGYFKRKFKADERDRQVAEAVKEAEADAAARAAQPRVAREPEPAPPPKPAPSQVNRAANHAAKARQQLEKEKAEAGMRAENVRRFEQKKADAERKQAERAKRQAERAAETD